MKSCLICIDIEERYRYFSRFISGEFSFEFITIRPTLFIMSKFNDYNCHLVRLSNDKLSKVIIDISKCRDYLSGFIKESDACSLSCSVLSYLEENVSDRKINYVILWNGTDVFERTVAVWANSHNVPIIYMEISNLPGKLFIDKDGVNAESSIYNSKGRCLKKLSFNKCLARGYIKKYKEVKGKSFVLPQGKMSRLVNYKFLLDELFRLFFRSPRFQSKSYLKKVYKALERKKITSFHHLSSSVPDKYLFLPLQLSNDSQLKLNSEVDNLEAIKICANIAINKNIKLVVKLHPAEVDMRMIEEYKMLQNEFKFIFSDENTIDLLEGCDLLVTINSTVGLEGLILDKDIDFLGRSFYSFFDNDDIYRYIDSFLFNCDYFSHDKIDFDELVEFFENRERIHC